MASSFHFVVDMFWSTVREQDGRVLLASLLQNRWSIHAESFLRARGLALRPCGFLLHSVTRLLSPQVTRYCGIIHYVTPSRITFELPFDVSYRSTFSGGRCEDSLVTVLAPCWQLHPQPRPAAVHVSGIAAFCTRTPTSCRIRFAYAMYHQSSITSFRHPKTPL